MLYKQHVGVTKLSVIFQLKSLKHKKVENHKEKDMLALSKPSGGHH
jgi:hypothetical protein